MDGIWLAVMVAALIMAGVATQLGWQLPAIPHARRRVRGRRPWADRVPQRRRDGRAALFGGPVSAGIAVDDREVG